MPEEKEITLKTLDEVMADHTVIPGKTHMSYYGIWLDCEEKEKTIREQMDNINATMNLFSAKNGKKKYDI